METEKDTIESGVARDCSSYHGSSGLQESTSSKNLPNVISGINSTDERPPRSRSSSVGGKTMDAESINSEKMLPIPSSSHQQLDTQVPLSLEVQAKNSLKHTMEERPMTNASEDGDSIRSVKSSTPTGNSMVDQGLESNNLESNNTAFEDFINSPKGQHAIVERSPGGRYVRFLEKLGSGASKDVYRAYDTTEGIEVAWNVVQLTGVPKNERNRIVNEVRLLERLHHSNIISFHGSWVNRERQEVNFVTEILSSGTLTSFIEKVQVIRWKIAKRWATQILKGLEYLHSQDPPVIHRDLKCENIFINGTSGDLRIGDLGLSTVHRNGKVLSVLGTPEFMAPDLYEDSAYDEKVDIYAFGMCLLEILTKEYPYQECSNPAQIYRKVMGGHRPDSLKRLRSRVAREFITLCLGYKDKTSGKYVRPSTSELLQHQFLNKSKNDDSEVIVDPPLQRETIAEITAGATHQTATEERSSGGLVPRPLSRRNTDDTADDESDKFEEMPDSEVNNIKKVKVFMGRNEELKEDEDEEKPEEKQPLTLQSVHTEFNHAQPAPAAVSSMLSSATEPQIKADSSFQNIQHTDLSERAVDTSSQVSPPNEMSRVPGLASQHHTHHPQTRQHITSAHGRIQATNQNHQYTMPSKVVEDPSAAMPHYQDNILKLIITLPVDGQTHNVQFDIDLVQDDPVEVAREMQRELGIPEEAILEISGTISSLARGARIKQGEHRKQQQVTQTMNTAPAGITTENHTANQLFHTQQQSLQPQQAHIATTRPTPVANENNSVIRFQNQQVSQALQPQQAHNTATGVTSGQGNIPVQSRTASGTLPPVQTSLLQQSGQGIVKTAALSAPQSIAQTSHSSIPQHTNAGIHTFPAVSQQMPPTPPTGRSPPMSREDTEILSIRLSNNNVAEDSDDDDDDEDSINEELGKLQEYLRRDMMRAKKVYDNRMDNLTRTNKEKEQRHIKTLEKHEKEKVQFEKRVKQEASEQSQRLDKIQIKYETERQKLVQKKYSSPPQR